MQPLDLSSINRWDSGGNADNSGEVPFSARQNPPNLIIPENSGNKYNVPMTQRTPMKLTSLLDFVKTCRDVDKLIVRPQVKSVSILEENISKEESSIMASDYIKKIVTAKNENIQAVIIQRAFRTYVKRRRYKTFIGLRIKFHRRLERVCFSAWRTTAVNSSLELHRTFDKFANQIQEMSFFMQDRKLAPMRFLYVTGELFVPADFTSKQIVDFVYKMNCHSLRRIVNIWKLTARRLIVHRTTQKFAKQTVRKVNTFGFIFEIFKTWRKFTQYKKIEEKTSTLDLPQISVQDSDPSPYWNAIEKKLNAGRAIKYEADKLRRRTIIKKVTKIIRSNARKSIFLRNCLEKSTNIDIKYRFKQAVRAWTEFVESQKQKRLLMHNIMQQWYSMSYKKAYCKTLIEFCKSRELRFFCQKILNRWCFIARRRSIKDIKNILSIQKNAGKCLPLAFGLSQRFEFFFETICFREWMRSARKRIAWKKFKKFNDELDPDAELAYGTLMELRSSDDGSTFLPYGIGISLELSLKADSEIKEGKVTEVKSMRKLPPQETDRRTNALSRAILLYLHSKLKYDVFMLQNEPPFERFRTEEELLEQIYSNAKKLTRVFSSKIQKDMIILRALDAHEACLSSSKIMNNFTPAEEAIMVIPNGEMMDNEVTPTEINAYDEYEISVDALVRAIDNAPPRLVSTLKKERDQHFGKFNAKLRKPNQIIREPLEQPKVSSNNPRTSKIQQEENQPKIEKDESSNQEVSFNKDKKQEEEPHALVGHENDIGDEVQPVIEPQQPASVRAPRFNKN